MKKRLVPVLVVCLVFLVSSCGSEPGEEIPTTTNIPTSSPIPPTETPTPRHTAKMPPESTTVYLEPVYRSIGAENVTHITSTGTVNDIAFDQEGLMWVATNGGVLRWDMSDSSYTKFTVEDGLFENSVVSLTVASDGSVWAITTKGLSYFDGNHWNIEIEDFGNIIGFDSEGNLWAHDFESLSYFKESEWIDVGNPQEDSPFWGVLDAEIGLDNTIWVDSWEGLWSFDGTTWTHHTNENGFKGTVIHVIETSTNGRTWIVTDEGLFSFDGRNWEEFPLPALMQLGNIALLALETENLWLSYNDYEDPENNGIYTFNGERWDKFTMPDDFNNLLVTSIKVAPEGAIVIGTNVGVFRIEGDTWQRYLSEDGPIGNMIYTVFKNKEGDLWFSTENGISRYDGSEWSSFELSTSYGSFLPYLQNFAETPDGRLISVGGQGIYVLEDGQWDLLIESPEWDIDPSIPPDVFETLYISGLEVSADGDIWVSGFFIADPYPGLGVFRYDGENWFHYTFEDWVGDLLILDREFVKTGVLPNDNINAMAIGPDGALWLGADEGGVIRFDGETWLTLSGPTYFSGDSIFAIAKGPDGSLWFATPNGFSHFDEYDWIVYDLGSDPSDYSQARITVNSQGVVWYFSGAYGMSSFDGETFSIYSIDGEDFNDFSAGSLTVDTQGTIWLSGIFQGLMTINIPEDTIGALPLITPIPTETPIRNFDMLSTMTPDAAAAT